MSQGPILVIADRRATGVLTALARASVFPVVEARWRDAGSAISSGEPAAVILANERPVEDVAAAIDAALASLPGPIVPVFALVPHGTPPPVAPAAPVAVDRADALLAPRLR